MAVDDPRPVEVVGAQLDPDAVAGEDPDAEAAHLARAVAEDLVAVVELHPEHGVRERFGDLALELDLVLFGHRGRSYLTQSPTTTLAAQGIRGRTDGLRRR